MLVNFDHLKSTVNQKDSDDMLFLKTQKDELYKNP